MIMCSIHIKFLVARQSVKFEIQHATNKKDQRNSGSHFLINQIVFQTIIQSY